MLETITCSWQRFKADPPGQRFQQQFKRRHAVARTLLQKALVVGGGVLLTGVGIFLFFLPGPGVLFVLLGAVLIAQQSVTVARGLDWTEIRLRQAARSEPWRVAPLLCGTQNFARRFGCGRRGSRRVWRV